MKVPIPPVKFVVESDFGCLTQPAFGAERVSYEIPPPPAARGIAEAIFFKPEFFYFVLSVAKVPHSSGRPTRYQRVSTNEVDKLSPTLVTEARVQRRNLILRDAAFLIELEIQPGSRPITKPGHRLETYREMLLRRVRNGQCFEHPFMGTRDCPISTFRIATDNDIPIDETRPLGPMTYFVWNRNNWQPRDQPIRAERRVVTTFAVLERGVVNMEEWEQ